MRSTPDYNTDKRSMHFSILTDKTTNSNASLDIIFETKFDCNENGIEEKFRTGQFSYQLYITDAVIETIDYSKLAAKEEDVGTGPVYRATHDKNAYVKYGPIYENSETSLKPVVHTYTATGELF